MPKTFDSLLDALLEGSYLDALEAAALHQPHAYEDGPASRRSIPTLAGAAPPQVKEYQKSE